MSKDSTGSGASPSDLMSCAELVGLVTDYLEGALQAPELAQFEEHVASCPPCRTYLAQMRRTVSSLGTLTEERIEPAAKDALLEAFRGWKGSQGSD